MSSNEQTYLDNKIPEAKIICFLICSKLTQKKLVFINMHQSKEKNSEHVTSEKKMKYWII